MLAAIYFSNSILFLFETLGFDINKIWVKRKFVIFVKNSELQPHNEGVPSFKNQFL